MRSEIAPQDHRPNAKPPRGLEQLAIETGVPMEIGGIEDVGGCVLGAGVGHGRPRGRGKDDQSLARTSVKTQRLPTGIATKATLRSRTPRRPPQSAIQSAVAVAVGFAF